MFLAKRRNLAAQSGLILLALLSSTATQAGILTGGELLSICEAVPVDPVYRMKMSECTGYIVGVADAFDCHNKVLGYSWDATKYAGQEKIIETVLDWLHFHPNVLNYQASGLVASALAEKYPCPSKAAANQP